MPSHAQPSSTRLACARHAWPPLLIRKGLVGRRFMTVFYALVCSSGLGINLANVALGRGERQLNIKAPAYVTHADWLYFPLFTCTMIMFSSFIFISGMPHCSFQSTPRELDLLHTIDFLLPSITLFSFVLEGGSDTMFFSLCMHLRCKCEILQKLFRHARRVRTKDQ